MCKLCINYLYTILFGDIYIYINTDIYYINYYKLLPTDKERVFVLWWIYIPQHPAGGVFIFLTCILARLAGLEVWIWPIYFCLKQVVLMGTKNIPNDKWWFELREIPKLLSYCSRKPLDIDQICLGKSMCLSFECLFFCFQRSGKNQKLSCKVMMLGWLGLFFCPCASLM